MRSLCHRIREVFGVSAGRSKSLVCVCEVSEQSQKPVLRAANTHGHAHTGLQKADGETAMCSYLRTACQESEPEMLFVRSASKGLVWIPSNYFSLNLNQKMCIRFFCGCLLSPRFWGASLSEPFHSSQGNGRKAPTAQQVSGFSPGICRRDLSLSLDLLFITDT